MSEIDEIRAELRRLADAVEKVIDLLPVATEHRDRLVDRHGALVGLADEIGEALRRAHPPSDAEFDAALQRVETRILAQRVIDRAARVRMG